MTTEAFKLFGAVLLVLQISSSFQNKVITSFDEYRLEFPQEYLESTSSLVENIFGNLTTENDQTDGLVTKLKFTNQDESKEANLWNGGSANTYKMDRAATVALRAYSQLIKTDKDAALNYHKKPIKIPAPFCPREDKIYCNSNYPYRTSNGSCNNLAYSWWGMLESPMKRLLPPDYEDRVSHPRVRSVTGRYLTNPRKIALVIHQHEESESPWSLFSLFFAQNVAHDVSLVAGATYANGARKKCTCDSSDRDCFNIPTPFEDKLNRNQKCMTFVRSSASLRDFDCNLGPREQINLLTHWLDLSQTYGSNSKTAQEVRSYKGGLLKSSYTRTSNLEQLPRLPGSTCPHAKRAERCFLAGDERAEENAVLTSIHALWLRDHNRVARALNKLNPKWDDETLYQEARRITIAVYQNIIYKELLPTIVGARVAKEHGLLPLSDGYLYKYNAKLYPQVANEFGSAAFRTFHTLIPDTQHKSDNFYRLYHDKPTSYFQFNSSLAYSGPLEDTLHGPIREFAYFTSPQTNPTLNNYLFENIFSNHETKRWSLPSLNIQRGRDHGIPGYNHYRKLCGLNYAYSFDELTHIKPYRIAKLKLVYEHVDDIDLWTGLVNEYPVDEAFMGPTAACIVAKQFSDLKFGDRFYFENGEDKNTRFTLEQLDKIRKVSISDVLCGNLDIKFIQKNAFIVANKKFNPLVNCVKRELDLSAWKDFY